MFRYIGLIWDNSNLVQREAASEIIKRLESQYSAWMCALDLPGMYVTCFHADKQASGVRSLLTGDGVILGTLFRGTSDCEERSTRVDYVDTAESERIVTSSGRYLADNYWGRYVGFIFQRESAAKVVVRDPTGLLPCLYTQIRGVYVFVSSIDSILGLVPKTFSINWSYIETYSVVPFVHCEQTGLRDVYELCSGQSIKIDTTGAERSFVWRPHSFTKSNRFSNLSEAAAAARRTLRSCVHTWASCYDGILHHLSGGLDSSIVLSALADAPTRPSVTAVNYYSPSGCGDERAYARLAANQARCRLIERERNPHVDLRRVLSVARSASPMLLRNRDVEVDGFEAQLADKIGAKAAFGGEWGDGLFFQGPEMFPAIDFVHRYGLVPSLFKTCLGIARLTDTSVWRILYSAIQSRVQPPMWKPYADAYKGRRLVVPELLDQVSKQDCFLHPWLRSQDGIPPGKMWHIEFLSWPPPFYSPLAETNSPESVEPLVSQPLMEVCLQIPTYVHSADGHDRSVARAAFVGDVPPQILHRYAKGRLSTFVGELLSFNRSFVRECLLDGELVKRGILNKAKVEQALQPHASSSSAGLSDVLDYVTIEAWISRWPSSTRQAAAVPA